MPCVHNETELRVLAGGIVDYYLGQPVTLADYSLRGMVKNTVQYCSGGGGEGGE